MRTRWLAGVVIACLLPMCAAAADWTAPDANLAKYEEAYGMAAEGYKRIRYNSESADVAKIKEQLAALGFFPYRVSNNYNRTLERSVRVFVGQMRIGGDGSEITPLMQAMLADQSSLPKAVCPVIDISTYSWEANGSAFTPYNYARLTRSSVVQDTQVGFAAKIVSVAESAGTYYYRLQLENDGDKFVYASYQPLPRTTVFQSGDEVMVFGTTQGLQSLTLPGFSEQALVVRADRVGFTAK